VCVLLFVDWPVFCFGGGSVLYGGLGCVHSHGCGGGGGVMVGGYLKGCQRFCWGIWYGRRLSGFWL
jgi:hypothetical protein